MTSEQIEELIDGLQTISEQLDEIKRELSGGVLMVMILLGIVIGLLGPIALS